MLIPARALDRQQQRLVEQFTVRETGQRVVVGHVRHTRLGLLELGDVEQQPLLEDHPARVVAIGERPVTNPHDATVGAHHPVIVEIAALAREERLALRLHPFAIIGVHHPQPHAGVLHVRLRGHPEDVLDLWTHVDRRVAAVLVDHRRHLLDETPIPSLGLEQLRDGLAPGEQLPCVSERHDERPVGTAGADLDRQRLAVRARQHRLERLLRADPSLDHVGDLRAPWVVAGQGDRLRVRAQDQILVDHQERLRGSIEQAPDIKPEVARS